MSSLVWATKIGGSVSAAAVIVAITIIPAHAAPTAAPSAKAAPARTFGVAPASGALGQVRDLRLLSESELHSLPGSTQVSVAGKIYALGLLREVHAALEASRAHAAALGAASRAHVRIHAFKPTGPGGASSSTLTKLSPTSGPSAAPSSASGPIVVPINPQMTSAIAGTRYPTDYLSYCEAANASVCIYVPSVPNSAFGPGGATVTDALISNPSVCTQTGGTMTPGGCKYTYPVSQVVQFVPPTKGFNTTSADTCGDFWLGSGHIFNTTVDPHGAVAIQFNTSGYPGNAEAVGCWFQVQPSVAPAF